MIFQLLLQLFVLSALKNALILFKAEESVFNKKAHLNKLGFGMTRSWH